MDAILKNQQSSGGGLAGIPDSEGALPVAQSLSVTPATGSSLASLAYDGTNKLRVALYGNNGGTPIAIAADGDGVLQTSGAGGGGGGGSAISNSTVFYLPAVLNTGTAAAGQRVVAAACAVTAIIVHNLHPTETRYLKLYNQTADVNPASDVPAAVFVLAPNDTFKLDTPSPLVFSNGLIVRATTGSGDTDNTAPATNPVWLAALGYFTT